MSAKWKKARQGAALWFKPGIDERGRKHLLISESLSGVEGGSHDHYWDNNDGTYGMQLRDKTGSALLCCDSKGHIYPKDTTFQNTILPIFVNKYLKELFSRSDLFD
jgi:hypothetical protein